MDFHLSFLFTCFCIPRVTNGKQLVCIWGFSKASLLPSSRFQECQQCLLGIVPQHDYWHVWCLALFNFGEKHKAETKVRAAFLTIVCWDLSRACSLFTFQYRPVLVNKEELWRHLQSLFDWDVEALSSCVVYRLLSYRNESSCRSTSDFFKYRVLRGTP